MRPCGEFLLKPKGVSDLERPASACLREVGSCSGDTHGMVLSDGPRLGHLRWDSGCRKDQGLIEKMARDSTNSRLRYTRAMPLTRSLKVALTHKEPFYPQARQRGLQEKKIRISKIKFRVSPSVLLSSTTPS